MALRTHPAANEFPLLEGREYEDLKADIAEHGLYSPITLWRGQLIDGRNRLRACRDVGIEPVFEDLDESVDPETYVVSMNLRRRHLAGHDRGRIIKRLAERRGVKLGSKGGRPSRNGNPANVAGLAKALDISERQLQYDVKAADEFDKLPKKLQADVGGGNKTLREAVRADREQKEIKELEKVSPEVAQRRKRERERLDRIEAVRGLANRVASTWLALDRTKKVAGCIEQDDPKLAKRLQQEVEKLIKAAQAYIT